MSITLCEWMVIKELAKDGASNKTIGERLGITEDTVKVHMKAALNNLDLPYRTRTSLALWFIRTKPAKPELQKQSNGKWGYRGSDLHAAGN